MNDKNFGLAKEDDRQFEEIPNDHPCVSTDDDSLTISIKILYHPEENIRVNFYNAANLCLVILVV